jgi:SNF2 family DNA or RNA helicase
MEVRTGKTLTSLAIAYESGAKKVLFITKKKAITDIIDQAKEMGYDMEIYITNFEQLQNVDGSFDYIIIDEAHSLGAFPMASKRAKELKRICQGKKIIYLSGTPSPESYSQLYHQFWVSSYSPFYQYNNFYSWAKDYVTLRKKYVFNRSINDYSLANYEMIKEMTNHLFISFTQEQAGFESLVDEEIHYVTMEQSTYKFADKLKKDKIAINADGQVVKGDTAVKLMNKIHQIYSGTVIIDEPQRTAKVFDYSKANYIKDKFKGKKIAIFYKFVAEFYALQWVFGNKLEFDAKKFNEATDTDIVFCSQIVSGREGINLAGADDLVFYNIDFSAVSYWQSRARIQTKDRTKESKIHWIFSLNGIEDKIYKAVMNKKDYTLNHFKSDFL